MKKILTSGIVFSMLMGVGAALADDNTTLTTKNYVDSGLRAVYNVADGVSTRVGDTTLTTNAQTVTGAINELDSAVGSLQTTVSGQGTTISGLQSTVSGQGSAITTLQGTVGDSTTGLVKDVADLQGTVGDTTLATSAQTLTGAINELKQTVQNADTQSYSAGTGITISGHTVSVAGLADKVSDGKKYVYQNGVLTELEVENTWDPSVLTTPAP